MLSGFRVGPGGQIATTHRGLLMFLERVVRILIYCKGSLWSRWGIYGGYREERDAEWVQGGPGRPNRYYALRFLDVSRAGDADPYIV